ATGFEISDTVTAYLGLTERWVLRPGRDLMLGWTESQGWSVAVEPAPAERPAAPGYLGRHTVLPATHAPARSAAGVIASRPTSPVCPDCPVGDSRTGLASRLTRYAKDCR